MSQDSQASETPYHPVAKALHWLVALFVALQFGIAWTMPDIGPHTKLGRLISSDLTVSALIALAVLDTGARILYSRRYRLSIT